MEKELYQNRFSNSEELNKKNEIWKVLCRNFFSKWISPQATVVDVAVGYCEFINNIQAQKKMGFDLNEVSSGGLSPEEADEWDGNVGARVLFKLCGWSVITNPVDKK